jgi:alpha-ketoglutarate-dependent taurine dioxygenase
MLNITPLQPLFAARIEGIDAAREVPAPIMAALRDALDRYAVLVLPGQRLDDAAQIAFSQGFGALEMTRRAWRWQCRDCAEQSRPRRRDCRTE